jgi:hypothetical protein
MTGTGRAWRVLAGSAFFWVSLLPCARADASLESALERIRHEWAVVMFRVAPEKRSPALETLAQMARSVAEHYPGEAEPLAWEGIVLASWADLRGPVFGYLAAQRARDLLLEAERTAPASLDGIGYGALARLYWNALPWPLSFGDSARARACLHKALATAPDTLEAQLLLTELLLEQGDSRGAARSAHRALAATGHSGLGDEVPPSQRRELIRLLVASESRH